jgi:ankyrin repeat protein
MITSNIVQNRFLGSGKKFEPWREHRPSRIHSPIYSSSNSDNSTYLLPSFFISSYKNSKSTKENENFHDDENMRRVKETRKKIAAMLKGNFKCFFILLFPFNSSAREL